MPQDPNKIKQFWQELKRRKVSRVITVYAAAAFVILELVDIIADPLKLPEWFLTAVIVFLCIGFIVAVILSWIYDVHPEGGIVKTEPAHKVKAEDVAQSSNSWKIASYISFIVIVVLIVLNVIPRANNKKEILDKSIAVLPFTSLSDDPEKQYLADGTMDAILLHLSKIEDLRVMARTSVEQYRETDKTATMICQELDVAYLLEGSFQKYGEEARLIVQLIEPGKEGHIWANEYNRNWKDIFSVQSEVAQAIAGELRAVITPEEKQLIEKAPTSNLTAYDFYQQGLEEFWKYFSGRDNKEALKRSEDLYHLALEYDSTYAQAYAGLTWLYVIKHSTEANYLSENYLDSVLILSDIALSYDNQLAEAYNAKGYYYSAKGLTIQALEEFNKAIKLNPNEYLAYSLKGSLYKHIDFVKSIYNKQKAVSFNRGPGMAGALRSLGRSYLEAGFTERTNCYLREALRLDGDSTEYYYGLMAVELTLGNYEKAIGFGEEGFALDSNDTRILNDLGRSYQYLGQHEESLIYFKKLIDRLKTTGGITNTRMHLIGYAYWQNGFKEEAEYYFNEQINYCNKSIELGRLDAKLLYSNYDLASVYAFRGEKDKAYENLRIFNQRQRMSMWVVGLMKDDPLFESFREEPEFQQIVRDVEAKYQAEHERVKKWLEENDML